MTDSNAGSTGPKVPAEGPAPDAVRTALAHVVESAEFKRSARLQQFLRFIVEEVLAGRGDALKEYTIGVEVFERDPSFDPQTSSIVRVEASRLRSKLEKYNAIDGRDDPVHIRLPPGSYTPGFFDNGGRDLVEMAHTNRDRVLSRPAVAVLPFTNMSGDTEQEYFADGLTEDIITVLSQARTFPVIARNSTFTYKGTPVRAQQVAEELGARYIVEGSVRKGGSRVRITVQLIDGETDHHIWAEKYDRELDDIFAVQDEITQRIFASTVPTLEKAEERRATSMQTESLDAWDLYLRGKAHLHEQTEQGTVSAREMFERAIAIDPGYARAYAELAYSHYRDLTFGYTRDPDRSLALCEEAALRAVFIDDADSWAQVTLGMAYSRRRQFDLALAQAELAMSLDPSGMGQVFYGMQLNYLGRPREGIPYIEKGIELSPKDPRRHFFMTRLADAYLHDRDLDPAVDWSQRAIDARPDYLDARLVLVASLSLAGRDEEAATAAAACDGLQPLRGETWSSNWFYLDSDALGALRDALQKAGFEG